MTDEPRMLADVEYLAEITRLTECLKRSNSNHEEFERRWYLVLEKVRADLSRAFRERDDAVTRRETADETLALYARSGAHLPATGITCDTEVCVSAIGVVGVKVLDVDAVETPLIALGRACGWTTEDDETRPRHYCPRCSADRKR